MEKKINLRQALYYKDCLIEILETSLRFQIGLGQIFNDYHWVYSNG